MTQGKSCQESEILKIGVPKEPENENRVAIVPSSMKKLAKAGFEVLIEKGAGVLANYNDSDTTQYLGKVKYDTDSYNQSLEEAIENEDIHIDTWADEDEPHQLTKIKLVEPMTKEEEDKNAGVVRDKDGNAVAVESMYGTKEESDVDVALNLQAESQRGK